MSEQSKLNQSTHWADITAANVVRSRGEKDVYVCASGITPSGTVHIGNFREIISVELVVRALREMGKNVRFIYSWDDFDVFRKVPSNMPNPDELKTWLRKPITLVPDPFGKYESYARANEAAVEEVLPLAGVSPEFIYQATRYMSSAYAEGIRTALMKKDVIKALLDEHRTEPLPDDWMPVQVFCEECRRDTTTVEGWDGEWSISYSCSSCGHKGNPDLRSTDCAKLPWRIDWPMRWSREGVDFEPAGKDHHSEGGSFDTAKKIVTEAYGGEPPVTFQYDFVRIKGRGGKISSSSGEVVSLPDVLEVYTPEVTRFLFAGTRPNTEFAISFDLDVLKIYEDYEKCERTYFTVAESDKARKKKEKSDRIYELSQVGEVPKTMPYQIPIRHLCNLLQIHGGDADAVMESLGDVGADQAERFKAKAACAWNWIREFAPEDFRFAVKTAADGVIETGAGEKKALNGMLSLVKRMDQLDEKEVAEEIYAVAKEAEMEPSDLFTITYKALIGKEKGPRLASFLKTIGSKKLIAVLSAYAD